MARTVLVVASNHRKYARWCASNGLNPVTDASWVKEPDQMRGQSVERVVWTEVPDWWSPDQVAAARLNSVLCARTGPNPQVEGMPPEESK